MRNSDYWIKHLDLDSHPEGGYFKEVYRSPESIKEKCLPERFIGDRNIATSIYFLLEKFQRSVFHRIKSDETWHFYDGENLSIYVIDHDNELIIHKLGLQPELNVLPQVTIPAHCWFAAESDGDYTLVGCTVAPGFDFNDFEMAKRDFLLKKYPEYENEIIKFTDE